MKLCHAARGHKQAQRKLTVRLLVERADYVAQVIDGVFGGLRASASVERSRISTGHHTGTEHRP